MALVQLAGAAVLFLLYRGSKNRVDAQALSNKTNETITNKRLQIANKEPRDVRWSSNMDVSTLGVPVQDETARRFTKAYRPTNRDLRVRARLAHAAAVNRVRRRPLFYIKGLLPPFTTYDGRYPLYYSGQFETEALNDGAGDLTGGGRPRDHW